MFNRLNIKLLLPSAVVSVFFILVVLIFLDENISKTATVGILFVMTALQLFLSFLYSNQQLFKRIENLQGYVNKVVSVNEAPESPLKDNHNDDLAKVINDLSDFIASLSDVIEEIRSESEALNAGSVLLTEKMSESVIAVDESANQIEQMAQSIEQVASTSQTLSHSANQVSETTSEIINILSQGTHSSTTSQQTLESCTKEVNETAEELALLQEECTRIGLVLDVIRGIADQTNLLALNAAIEAARAGEQGRGFAVVADEVRALAHRTQESTVEIHSMVEGLQEKSTNAVNAIARGQSLTQESLTYSEEVVAAFGKMGEVFTDVDNLTSQMASGTNDQQISTASINDNMMAIVSLSQEINQGLTSVAKHASEQQDTTSSMDITLNRICV